MKIQSLPNQFRSGLADNSKGTGKCDNNKAALRILSGNKQALAYKHALFLVVSRPVAILTNVAFPLSGTELLNRKYVGRVNRHDTQCKYTQGYYTYVRTYNN